MQEDGAPGVRAPAVRQLRAQARWAGPSVFRFEGDPVKRTPQQRRLCVASIFRVKYLPKKARGREPERRRGRRRGGALCALSHGAGLAEGAPAGSRGPGMARLRGRRPGRGAGACFLPGLSCLPGFSMLAPGWVFRPRSVPVRPLLSVGAPPPPPAASTGRCSPLPARPSSLPLSEVLPVGGCAGVTGRAVSRGTGS